MKFVSRRALIFVCLLAALPLFGNTVYIQAKAKLAQYLIAEAWQTTLQTHTPTPPWAWADTHPIAHLRVARLGISQYVLAGANGSPLAFGPGWYAGTKAIGQNEQNSIPDSVIAGHHNTHFAFLKSLVIGDELTLQNRAGKTLAYRVSHIDTFDSRYQRLPTYSSGKTLQLVTCLPDFVGEIHPAKRLVVTLLSQLH